MANPSVALDYNTQAMRVSSSEDRVEGVEWNDKLEKIWVKVVSTLVVVGWLAVYINT